MKTPVPYLRVYLLLLTWGWTCGSGDITCTATTSLTQSTVTCFFHGDLSQLKNNFNVQFYYPPKTNSPDHLLACNWLLTGSTQCVKSQGVQINNNITDRLTFTAPPMVGKVGGEYMCHVLTRDDVTEHPCTLVFTGGVETAQVTAPAPAPENLSSAVDKLQILVYVMLGVTVAVLIFLVLLVLLLCKKRTRANGVFSGMLGDRGRKRDVEVRHPDVPLLPLSRENRSVETPTGQASGSEPMKGKDAFDKLITAMDKEHTASGSQPGKGKNLSDKLITAMDNRQFDSEEPRDQDIRVSPPAEQTPPVTSDKLKLITTPHTEGVDVALGTANVAVEGTTGELRILIIGKSRSGKSSLANTITGENKFLMHHGVYRSVRNQSAEWWTGKRFGKAIKVVDTPDLSTFGLTSEKKRQIGKWKEMTSPEPSAILLVMRGDLTFTITDFVKYEELKTLWADDNFCGRLYVVRTFAEHQTRAMEEERPRHSSEFEKVLADAHNLQLQVNINASREEKDHTAKRILNDVTAICTREATKQRLRDSTPHERVGYQQPMAKTAPGSSQPFVPEHRPLAVPHFTIKASTRI